MWIHRSEDGNCLFQLCPGRGSEWPLAMLDDYRGLLQTDAYAGYDILFRHGAERIPIDCWAHLRRKFEDAANSAPELIAEIDAMLKLLFRIEADAKDHSAEARQKWRDDLVRPLLAQIKDLARCQGDGSAAEEPDGRGHQARLQALGRVHQLS